MLFFNSESWTCISKKSFKSLLEFFCKFFRCLYRIGAGAPIPNFFWLAGFFTPENQVLQRKLNFFHHLANLSEDSLAKEVFTIQKEKSHNGLVKELKEHTDLLGEPTSVSKFAWKKKVLQYTKQKNKRDLIDMASKYKKIDSTKWEEEEFERKDFFHKMNLHSIRMMMRIKGGMVKTIRSNLKQKYRRNNQSIKCCGCIPK